MNDLLEEMRLAAKVAEPTCSLCDLLKNMDSGEAREMNLYLEIVGVRKLAAIFRKNNHPIGRRTIERHKKENHEQRD